MRYLTEKLSNKRFMIFYTIHLLSPEHPSSPLVICGFRVAQSLVFCTVCYRSLFLYDLKLHICHLQAPLIPDPNH